MTLARIVTSVTNTLFVIVLAAGYYLTRRVSQNTGSYPMKVIDINTVIAGDGEPAEAWGVTYTHESKMTARDVKVWVVCQS